MKHFIKGILLATVSLNLFSPMANAEEPNRPHTFATTVSATLPFIEVFEVSVEYAFVENWSAVIMLGSGVQHGVDRGDEPRRLWEGGLQLRYELVGDFDDGFGISALVRYLSLEPDDDGKSSRGLALGPHLYWRIISAAGLTLDVHLGAVSTWASLNHADGAELDQRQEFGPSGGLNIGWSFGQ